MLYAILCYDSEAMVGAWTPEHEEAAVAKKVSVQCRLADAGKLKAVLRLMPTTAATTVRASVKPLVTDGPFAETREQLLGVFVIDCPTLEEAIAVTRELSHESGALEIRPLRAFLGSS
jgi:hypothetical protein